MSTRGRPASNFLRLEFVQLHICISGSISFIFFVNNVYWANYIFSTNILILLLIVAKIITVPHFFNN